MEFRKDSEVADWALSGAKPLGRPLALWEREALRRKRRSLLQAAAEMEDLAMSGTASPKMAEMREKSARKYREQIAELEKVMAKFKILEGKVQVTKRQLRRIIKEVMTGPYDGGGVGDAGDEVLRKAMAIFGGGALVDERGGEIVIDTGVTDTDVEELYSEWIYEFPDAVHEEGGVIYTGVMV